jgi:hypothetical protein
MLKQRKGAESPNQSVIEMRRSLAHESSCWRRRLENMSQLYLDS